MSKTFEQFVGGGFKFQCFFSKNGVPNDPVEILAHIFQTGGSNYHIRHFEPWDLKQTLLWKQIFLMAFGFFEADEYEIFTTELNLGFLS